jgi:3-keto-disaccharide hydrolase
MVKGMSRRADPTATWILYGTLLALGLAAPTKAEIKFQEWKFDSEAPGGFPAGFIDGTLNRDAGHWEVVTDTKAPSRPNVLVHVTAMQPGTEAQIIFIDGLEASSFDLTLRLKEPAAGEKQGAGVVFRAIDERNYYFVWLSSQENLLRLDKVVDGAVTHLQDLAIDSAQPGKWHTLRLLIHGPIMEAIFNNRQFLSGREERWEFGTYRKGKIGLWAKGSEPVYFDTVRYSNMDDTTGSQGPFGTEPRSRQP